MIRSIMLCLVVLFVFFISACVPTLVIKELTISTDPDGAVTKTYRELIQQQQQQPEVTLDNADLYR